LSALSSRFVITEFLLIKFALGTWVSASNSQKKSSSLLLLVVGTGIWPAQLAGRLKLTSGSSPTEYLLTAGPNSRYEEFTERGARLAMRSNTKDTEKC